MILVESPGLMTTVQDLGREGFGPLGVSASGAADPIALRIGNRLLGNPEGAAALESTLVGGGFRFGIDTWVAITGSDFGPTLDEAPVANWAVHRVHKGQLLRLQSTRSGARCYVCVSGGIDVPLVLGSASTHVLSGLGGFDGRALRKGDALKAGPCQPPIAQGLSPAFVAGFAPRLRLRVTEGPQFDWFSNAFRSTFFATTYRVTEASDRMGLRLEGAAVEFRLKNEMITSGVALGAIQVPAGGQPVIVFVEQQTTGGYPVIGNVIAADLPSVGQLRPRNVIDFELISHEQARMRLLEQESSLEAGELQLS